MSDQARVKRIWQQDDRTLAINWTDGRKSLYDVVELRRQCRCANCVDEMTRKRTLNPDEIPESVRPVKVESVGRYALTIHFTDGHRTGIYPFERLREIG
ncbi:MAG TPA: DUF971 domain-containing protein [Oligoflexus sp.]|uniref:DUF971 domain-containing protein n=1 Tax=Oligoflexus sp. TaxID=1971216 RepID=UPI002D65AE3E|nr:DUF971 domain-containing protein [Oligoflexus sp.]HYX33530.1 DUF971 domain-containing protein [Oligoflexus sp.]